ncbi:Aromatic-L-amino-acid decarboxylase [Bertholletia excelsa]
MGSFSTSHDQIKHGYTSKLNLLDPEEFRRQGHMVIDFLAYYYKNVEKYPVRSQVEPGYLSRRLPESAPRDPEPMEAILQDVRMHIIPGITHWQSPTYFAYFPASASIAGFLGEIISSGLNVVGFNWISSPAATELEGIVMDWLGKMLQLPNSFLLSGGGRGVIQGTTCEAILCTLVAARDQIVSQMGWGCIGKLVVYGSDQTHFALEKATKIAGMKPENFRAIRTTKSTALGLSVESSTAVDPVGPLCGVAKRHGMWIHVDAAYAGSACICPEFRHFIDGIEGANSFSLNARKWFFTNLDCCCLWLKDQQALIKAVSTNPECLKNKATDSKQVVDFKDMQIVLSRRFRAIKLWLVLRSYGTASLRNFITAHVNMAKHFERLVTIDKRLGVVVPRNFAMVCFRVSPRAFADHAKFNDEMLVNEFNNHLLESINAAGLVFMTHAVIGGVYAIRFAVGASLTNYEHVNKAWRVIQDHANAMLATSLNGQLQS